ncbi:MAG: hypothetical protein ACRD0A_18180 [Acidimicrobiales bacterium]
MVDDAVVPWTAAGYGPARRRPATGAIDVITPPASVAALRAGFEPQLDRAASDRSHPPPGALRRPCGAS